VISGALKAGSTLTLTEKDFANGVWDINDTLTKLHDAMDESERLGFHAK